MPGGTALCVAVVVVGVGCSGAISTRGYASASRVDGLTAAGGERDKLYVGGVVVGVSGVAVIKAKALVQRQRSSSTTRRTERVRITPICRPPTLKVIIRCALSSFARPSHRPCDHRGANLGILKVLSALRSDGIMNKHNPPKDITGLT